MGEDLNGLIHWRVEKELLCAFSDCATTLARTRSKFRSTLVRVKKSARILNAVKCMLYGLNSNCVHKIDEILSSNVFGTIKSY